MDEARRIASNIAKLPTPLGKGLPAMAIIGGTDALAKCYNFA